MNYVKLPNDIKIILIAHNLRSTHNVGALLRTADGLGINQVYLTGYTPYPLKKADERLPHLSVKLERDINKTALGAQTTVAWEHLHDAEKLIKQLIASDVLVCALEQTSNALSLPGYQPPQQTKSIALVVGREVEGIEPDILSLCDVHLKIPMLGSKESFNVTQAAAMALFYLRHVLKDGTKNSKQ